MDNNYLQYGEIIKVLSDESRLKIIDILSCGQMCACDILELVNISQSTLSYHMKMLCDSQLVIGVKDGSWMRYSLNKDQIDLLMMFLDTLFHNKEECICKVNSSDKKVNL